MTLSQGSGVDNLLLGLESVSDYRCQVPRLPELLDALLRHGVGHPLALRAGSEHGRSIWWQWERLGLGRWSSRTDGLRKEKAWGEEKGSYPLIKAVNIKPPPPRTLKLAYSQGVVQNSTVGLPKLVLMRIPQ